MRTSRLLNFTACVLFWTGTALPALAQEPALTIRVVPRIGLFNAMQYRASENDPRPKGCAPSKPAGNPFPRTPTGRQ